MEEYIKLNKYRKQLEYINKLIDVLTDVEDGDLFIDFTEQEEDKFIEFIDFMREIEKKVKNKLEKIERSDKNEL